MRLLAVVSALALLSSSALAQSNVEKARPCAEDAGHCAVASGLRQSYEELSQAVAGRDAGKVAAFYVPNAEIIDILSAHSNAAEYVFAGLFARSRNNSVTFALQDIKTNGINATVRVEGFYRLASLNNNQWTPIVANITSEDVLENINGAWKITQSRVLSQRQTIDPEFLAAMRTDASTAQPVASELKQAMRPLSGVEAGYSYQDLTAFGEAVGDSRIVSLGEATHGTREFFQMKHRLLEYLVHEKGFTVFAIEANWPESLAIDRYIKTSEGDPKAGLLAMYFWTWQTAEVLDMIEWMRAFNKAPGTHPVLSFTSFDMQVADVAADHVLAFLRKADPQEARAAGTAYAELPKLREGAPQSSMEAARPIAQGAGEVAAALDAKREALLAATSPEAWRDARQAAEIVHQAVSNRTPRINADYRDEMMARNVEWLADHAYPGQKIVLWAHNAHVSMGSDSSYKWMGAWLRGRLRSGIYQLGFRFRAGTARAMSITAEGKNNGVTNNLVPLSPAGSGDAVLSAAGSPLFFLDLHSVRGETALGRWLRQPHLFRSLGAIWYEQTPDLHFQLEVLTDLYDGIIFVENTHPSRGLLFAGSSGEWACKADRARFCAEVQPGQGRIIACLKGHRAELSAPCSKIIPSH